MKVLIIDDEIDLSLLLQSYFQRKGLEVMLCHSLAEGLEEIVHFLPDFLFLDNNMPDGLGWEEAPALATAYPVMHQFLVSAYHPAVPLMPDHAKYTVLEKPISFADLDALFETPTATASENEASQVDI